jgi:glycosyltransferase involved in cell wall biosynthesis
MGWRSVCCFDRLPEGRLLQAYQDCGMVLRKLRSTRTRLDVSSIREFRSLFLAERPRVINVHFGATGINALIAARLCGVGRRVWTKHSLDAISYRAALPWPKRWIHTINYEAMWTTDIIAVSGAVRRELEDHSIRRRVRQFYLGVDLQRFAQGGRVEEKRRLLGIPSGRSVVSCIGQARPEKGVEFLIRAVALLPESPPRPCVLIVGGGPLTEDLSRLAADLGVTEVLRFCGVRNDVEDILALSDFTVLPSLEEAVSLTLMESLAAGRPVVASRVGGIPELLEDGVNGLLVPPGDAAALARAMSALCRDHELLRRLARGAVVSAGRLDVRQGVRETIALYMGGDAG